MYRDRCTEIPRPTFTLYANFVHIIVVGCKSKFAFSGIFFLIQDMASGIRDLTKETTKRYEDWVVLNQLADCHANIVVHIVKNLELCPSQKTTRMWDKPSIMKSIYKCLPSSAFSDLEHPTVGIHQWLTHLYGLLLADTSLVRGVTWTKER